MGCSYLVTFFKKEFTFLGLALIVVSSLLSCKLDDNRVRGTISAPSLNQNPVDTINISFFAASTALIVTSSQFDGLGLKASYQIGNQAPDNCDEGTAVPPAGLSNFSNFIEGLNPDTNYSFRFCSVEGVSNYEDKVATITTLKSVSLTDIYSGNGSWNDFVKNDGSSPYDASNTPCDGANNNGYESCIHGGEKKEVNVPAEASCENLTASDYQGAFDWICDDSLGTATFRTQKLKQGKRLADLIDSGAWKRNFVVVKKSGTELYATTPEPWHQNSIVPLPENQTGSLLALTNGADSKGRIYFLPSDLESDGYEFSENKMSLVVAPGAKLKFYGSGATAIFIKSSGNYNYFEGYLNANGSIAKANVGLDINNLKHNRVRSMTIEGASQAGIQVLAGNSHFFYDLILYSNDTYALLAGFCSFTRYDQLLVVKNNFLGSVNAPVIDVSGGNYNIITNSYFYNNNGDPLFLDSNASKVVNLTAANNSRYITVDANYSTLSHVTSANSGGGRMYSAHDSTLSQYLLSNVDRLHYSYTDNNTLYNIAMLNSAFSGLYFSNSDNNSLHSYFISDTCTDGGTNINPPLDGSCNPQNGSTAVYQGSKTSDGVFAGKVSLDQTNTNGTTGSEIFDSIVDWLNFDNLFRGWGKQGSVFPNPDNKDHCISTETCQIWDWRVSLTDTKIRNVSLDGLNQNDPFISGSTCPAAVHGNEAITDSNREIHRPWIIASEMNSATGGNDNGICESGEYCANTYLLNATEILYDDIGDDDGLCESNEACIYSPNIGAYQGEGDYLSNGTCTFQDGTVTGVTMYAYPINGV